MGKVKRKKKERPVKLSSINKHTPNFLFPYLVVVVAFPVIRGRSLPRRFSIGFFYIEVTCSQDSGLPTSPHNGCVNVFSSLYMKQGFEYFLEWKLLTRINCVSSLVKNLNFGVTRIRIINILNHWSMKYCYCHANDRLFIMALCRRFRLSEFWFKRNRFARGRKNIYYWSWDYFCLYLT